MPIYGVAVQPVAKVLDIKTPKPLVSFKQIGFDFLGFLSIMIEEIFRKEFLCLIR